MKFKYLLMLSVAGVTGIGAIGGISNAIAASAVSESSVSNSTENNNDSIGDSGSTGNETNNNPDGSSNDNTSGDSSSGGSTGSDTTGGSSSSGGSTGSDTSGDSSSGGTTGGDTSGDSSSGGTTGGDTSGDSSSGGSTDTFVTPTVANANISNTYDITTDSASNTFFTNLISSYKNARGKANSTTAVKKAFGTVTNDTSNYANVTGDVLKEYAKLWAFQEFRYFYEYFGTTLKCNVTVDTANISNNKANLNFTVTMSFTYNSTTTVYFSKNFYATNADYSSGSISLSYSLKTYYIGSLNALNVNSNTTAIYWFDSRIRRGTPTINFVDQVLNYFSTKGIEYGYPVAFKVASDAWYPNLNGSRYVGIDERYRQVTVGMPKTYVWSSLWNGLNSGCYSYFTFDSDSKLVYSTKINTLYNNITQNPTNNKIYTLYDGYDTINVYGNKSIAKKTVTLYLRFTSSTDSSLSTVYLTLFMQDFDV